MSLKILNIGYNNSVSCDRIVAIIGAEPLPSKRLKDEAKRQGKLVDATNGRKTRSIVITDSNHVILSSIEPETLSARLVEKDNLGCNYRSKSAGQSLA